MKFGVKTFFDAGFADYFKDKADFLEVMAIPGKDYSFLEGYPLPIVIHALHFGFGVNFADPDLVEKNREAVDFAVELADKVGAEKIIVHPGRLVNESCSVEEAVEFFKGLDSRIIIENQTVREDKGICARPDEMRSFVEKVGREICFDVNHAMEVACEDALVDSDKKLPGAGSGVDYFSYIEEFVGMGPAHCHLGGGIAGDRHREHLSFEGSDFSIERVLGMLPGDAWVTIETTTDIGKVEKDLEFLRSCVD
jgi:hypothetical protein